MQVLQPPDQGLFGEVKPKLLLNLSSKVIDAGIWRDLQHSLDRLIKHLCLTIDVLLVTGAINRLN